MSNLYEFFYIEGLQTWVIGELTEKFSSIHLIRKTATSVLCEIDGITISDLLQIRSALRVRLPNGKFKRLDKRHWRVAFVPAGLNPTIAYVMCKIANVKKSDVVYDPFCGSGTIPITAKVDFHVEKVFASDVSGRAIDVLEKNLQSAGILDDVIYFRSNISMVKLVRHSITKIVSNLPYGIRSGDHEKNVKTYKIFRDKLKSLLTENGLAVVLTQEKKLIEESFGQDFEIQKITDVHMELQPSIYKIYGKMGK